MFQHEGGRAAFDDARKQMDNILKSKEEKFSVIEQMKNDLKKRKLESLKAQEEEQVSVLSAFFVIFFHAMANDENTSLSFQECIKEQETLIPLEQAARQRVAELKSVMDSEKSQGSVLKAILKAKESNQIEGIYGRMGDLGAIEGEFSISGILFF